MPWPVPTNAAELAEAAGLELQRQEFLIFHVHAHLDVFVNGEPVEIPAAIGIDITDPGVQSGEVNGAPAYGGIEHVRRALHLAGAHARQLGDHPHGVH